MPGEFALFSFGSNWNFLQWECLIVKDDNDVYIYEMIYKIFNGLERYSQNTA